jgi:hypothetical protein
VVAREGDEQEPRQVTPDQLLEPICGGQPILDVEGRTMGDQQARAACRYTVMGCGAHGTSIGTGLVPASSLTGVTRYSGGGSRVGAGAVRSATLVSAAGGAAARVRTIGPVVSNV